MAPDGAHAGRAVAAAGLAAVARRVHVEIARQIPRAAVVTPEVQRHGRNGLGADQLAHGVQHRATLLVPGLDGGAEHAALHLAGSLRQFAVAADEGACEVGAARDVAPPDVGHTRLRHEVRAPLLHLGAERRSGGAQRADGRQIAALRGRDARLHAVGVEGRARAKEGHAGLGGKAPQQGPVGVLFAAAGVAVKNHAGGSRQQATHLRVPHHPAGGAVPVVALAPAVGGVAAAKVVVQRAQLQLHQHHAAVAVHDGFGQAGGAAGVDDPQRMVERQPERLERIRFMVILACSACPACATSY